MLSPQVSRSPELSKKTQQSKSYNEIATLLNVLPKVSYEASAAARVKQLDTLCGSPSQKVETILVGGTNGKSTAIHFASKLLQEEGFIVGSALSSHFMSYNERIDINSQPITNRHFAEVAGKVLDLAQKHKISATTFEIITVASLLHFANEGVNLALIEVSLGGRLDATAALKPKLVAITRVTADDTGTINDDLDAVGNEMIGVAPRGSWLISAEQSKLRLQKMKTFSQENGLKWAMPVRKLAPLPYMFEQLFGRTASLGERIAQIYVEDIKGKFSPFLRGNLLATQKGQRGRPTLEAKRKSELNPIKTLKKFWAEQFSLLRGRFELLEKEKPTVLLDNADNYDALSNLFLGIRLLHYRRPLKGVALVLGLRSDVNVTDTLKLARYLLKKINGKLFFTQLPEDVPCHDASELAQAAHAMNIKAHAFNSLKEAFNAAKSTVDDKYGVVVIAGSGDMVSSYWKTVREIKKF